MTITPVLELRNIRAAYGRIEVLHGVDLVVPPRSVVALLGPNGAGKTTTLRVASGQHRPSSGCLHVMGRHVNGADPDALSRAGGVQAAAARLLGVTERSVWHLVKKHRIDVSRLKTSSGARAQENGVARSS